MDLHCDRLPSSYTLYHHLGISEALYMSDFRPATTLDPGHSRRFRARVSVMLVASPVAARSHHISGAPAKSCSVTGARYLLAALYKKRSDLEIV